MLTITFKIPGESIIRHKDWHIGEKNPIPYNGVNSVIDIQADGDELRHIQSSFTNIPIANVRVMRWFGDIARTIIANLTN